MYQQAAAGNGLVISDNFAELQHLRVGDPVEIAAPYGVIRLPVVGILVDYSDQQGSILMDRSLFIKYWHDDSVNVFRIYTKPEVDGPDRQATDSGALRRSTSGIRADERRTQGLHHGRASTNGSG